MMRGDHGFPCEYPVYASVVVTLYVTPLSITRA